MGRIAAVTLALALAACGGSTEPPPVSGGTEVILELGQAARLSGTSITVALRSVDDSRCRPDVVCVWEGNARIVVDLSEAAGPEIAAELNTHPTLPQALTFRYVRIELTELEPLPTGTRPVVIYRAHLRWSYLSD
jgi:hypothetical protein